MQNMPTISKKINANAPSPKIIGATKVWQNFIGVTPDGAFGPKTDAATRSYQDRVGLKNDGVVGPKTWATVPEVGPPTAVQAAIKAENAAVTASQKIAASTKVPTPKPQPVSVPVAVKPAPVAKSTTTPKAAEVVKNAAGTVTRVATDTAKQTQDVFRKQPLWIRIVTATAFIIGAVAGIKLMAEPKRKSA